MSRAAAAKASKEEGKANRAQKDEQKAREKSLGLTGEIKKAIGADVLLCTSCGATQMGPLTVCECKGGKVRPGPDNDGLPELIAAAKARLAAGAADRMKETQKDSAAVAKAREKRKEGREAEANDLTAEFQGDDIEMVQNVEFPIGKLGMEIETNCISKVTDGGQAQELKVQVGWVICKVDGEFVEPNKKAIAKAAMSAMKKGPCVFGFRVPITEGYHHCKACNKFLETENFDEEQLSSGPGVQMCSPCAEFADMGDF